MLPVINFRELLKNYSTEGPQWTLEDDREVENLGLLCGFGTLFGMHNDRIKIIIIIMFASILKNWNFHINIQIFSFFFKRQFLNK